MAAENTTGFLIDGDLCEMPSLDTFTMDEAQVLYDYSGLTIEDFAPAEDAKPNKDGDYDLDESQQEKLKNPGFMRAMLHIAYQRKHPKMNGAKVKALVGSVNLIELLEQLAVKQEDEAAVPLASTTEPEGSSPNGSVESKENSGLVSEPSSEPPAVPPRPITTIGSATSSTPSPASSAV